MAARGESRWRLGAGNASAAALTSFGSRRTGLDDPLAAPTAAGSLGAGRRLGVLAAPAHILIACMPKSGSTFLTDVIAELPGLRRVSLAPTSDRREQEIDEYCLQQVDRLGFVAQHHVRYSDWTAEMCRDYGLAPVVLVRSLLDVIVSLRDHMRRESTVWPMFFVEPRHAALDDARMDAMIARLALPWYLNFYMG